MSAVQSVILKANVKRTVRLEHRMESGRAVQRVIKRFHSPGALDRLRDRSRVWGERRLLERLAQVGLPVPRPLEVRRVDGRWELSTQYVEDATSFERALSGGESWPVAPERSLRDLGRLLARVHAVGLRHADLHGGNVLITSAGELWLVDLGRSRILRPVSARRMERDLTRLAAGVRETLRPASRARFLAAYLKALEALEPGLARNLPERRALARRVEDHARTWRARLVRRSRDRWTRDSSLSRSVEVQGLVGWARRDVRDNDLCALCAQLGETIPQTLLSLPHASDASREVLVLRSGWRQLERCYTNAARLHEHGLPTVKPLALLRSPERMALFELPAGCLPFETSFPALADRERRHLLHSLGRLFGGLWDRALGSQALAASRLWIDPARNVLVGPGVQLGRDPQARRASLLETLARAAGGLSRRERGLLAAGTLGANRSGSAQAARWRTQLS